MENHKSINLCQPFGQRDHFKKDTWSLDTIFTILEESTLKYSQEDLPGYHLIHMHFTSIEKWPNGKYEATQVLISFHSPKETIKRKSLSSDERWMWKLNNLFWLRMAKHFLRCPCHGHNGYDYEDVIQTTAAVAISGHYFKGDLDHLSRVQSIVTFETS